MDKNIEFYLYHGKGVIPNNTISDILNELDTVDNWKHFPKDERNLKVVEEQNKNAVINPYMTKQLELMVKEIDGNRDPMTIAQFIQTMPIRDSQSIRKIVRENSPSLDLTIPVLTPSNEEINARITFGVEFFRPFYGI